MLLVQDKGGNGGLSAFTAVLFYHSAMNTWTVCSIVITGFRVHG